MMKRNKRGLSQRITTMLAAGLLFLPIGCGYFENAGTISGTVRYKEQPLTEGSVSFLTEKGQTLTATIDSSGRYAVSHVPVGPARIAVQVANAGNPAVSFAPTPKKSQDAAKSSTIPLRFSVAATSGLRHTVTKGKQAFDIELK